MKKSVKSILCILLLAGLSLCFAGCDNSTAAGEDGKNTDELSGDASTGEDSEDVSDLFSDPSSAGRLGMFNFGIVAPNDEMQVYEYTGQEIHIPYKVEGMDEGVSSDFGLMVFVDGLLQPYRIEKKNGEVSEEKFMQKFYLEYEEAEEFDIVFTPVTGKEGARLGIVFSTIFQPDYMPDESRPNYGVYHRLSANNPQEIYFKSGTVSEKEQSAYSEALVEDIPQEIKDAAGHIIIDGSDDYLDEAVTTELLAEDGSKEIFYAQNGKIKLKFRIYGGIEAAYRTTIFVNHNPIQVMGSDYIETATKKGKMTTVELELDTESYEKLNTIYAISNPAGKDYLTVLDFPIKTKSILLVNN